MKIRKFLAGLMGAAAIALVLTGFSNSTALANSRDEQSYQYGYDVLSSKHAPESGESDEAECRKTAIADDTYARVNHPGEWPDLDIEDAVDGCLDGLS